MVIIKGKKHFTRDEVPEEDRDNGPKPVERDKDGLTPREKQRILTQKIKVVPIRSSTF